MRTHPLHKLLLVTALLLGQWLAIAHDYQHPANAPDQACQVCAYGNPLQTGPASSHPSLSLHQLALEVPASPVDSPVHNLHKAHAPIRAPPESHA